jgi:hypothetical protein
MRKLLALVLPAVIVPVTRLPLQAQQATGMHATMEESHEGVTISVDPWTTASRYKEKFPKKSPYYSGVIALRLTFHNDTSESIKVDLQNIRLLVFLSEENRQELAPLTAEDVADTVLLKNNGKDPTSKRVPIPVPLGKPTGARDKNWTELKEACQNAALPSSVLAAHGTLDGLIYFDLRGEIELLQSARLYVPNLTTMTTKQPLLYFDIPLGRGALN